MHMTRTLSTFVLAAILGGCGGGSNSPSSGGPTTPTGPSSPSGQTGGSCRVVATASTLRTTAQGFSSETSQTCTFAAGVNQVTCTSRYSDNTGQSSTLTTVTTYASVGDLVDEVQSNPPRFLALSTATTTVGSAGTFSNSTQHTYDGQKRLVRIVGTSAAGTSTTTYTAWDASGRPTAANDVGPGFNNSLSISYDNAARTRTTSVLGLGLTTTETFDANGNPIRQVVTAGGAVSSTTDITPLSTQQICR